MSGHSKWSQIKRQKGATDAKRANVFTKLAKSIIVAAKLGKGLDLAVEKAKSANMPKEKIENAIARGQGKIEGDLVEEITYEAYGPDGVAVMIKTLTDNKNRTISSLRTILNKYHGNMATSGAVSYLFQQKGIIEILFTSQALSKEIIEEVIIESGAEDYEESEDRFMVYTKPKELETVKKALEFRAIKVESAKLEMIPKTHANVDEAKKESIIKLLTALEEDDDIEEVFTNASL